MTDVDIMIKGPAPSGCFSSAFLFSLRAVAFSLRAAALTGLELSSAMSLEQKLGIADRGWLFICILVGDNCFGHKFWIYFIAKS